MKVEAVIHVQCVMCHKLFDVSVEHECHPEAAHARVNFTVELPAHWWVFTAVSQDGCRSIRGVMCQPCLDKICPPLDGPKQPAARRGFVMSPHNRTVVLRAVLKWLLGSDLPHEEIRGTLVIEFNASGAFAGWETRGLRELTGKHPQLTYLVSEPLEGPCVPPLAGGGS